MSERTIEPAPVEVKPCIIIIGAPGSGASTHAQKINEKYKFRYNFLNLRYLSTSVMLKDEIKTASDNGNRAKSFVDEKRLVPDELICSVLKSSIRNTEGKRVLLDGFPKTVNQAKDLGGILGENKKKLYAVIYLDVPENKLMERMAKKGMTNKETATKALDEFYKNTSPVLTYYEKQRLLRKIDGSQDIDAVWKFVSEEVSDAIDKYKLDKKKGLQQELNSEGDGREEAIPKVVDEPINEEDQKDR